MRRRDGTAVKVSLTHPFNDVIGKTCDANTDVRTRVPKYISITVQLLCKHTRYRIGKKPTNFVRYITRS